MELQCLFCWRKPPQFFISQSFKQNQPQPINVAHTKTIMWIIEAAYTYFLIRLNSFKSTLYSVQLFTWMNTIGPPKSCDKRLPGRNDFKATLHLLCLKSCLESPLAHWLLLQMEKNFSQPLVYVTSVWTFLITVICYCSAFRQTGHFYFDNLCTLRKTK